MTNDDIEQRLDRAYCAGAQQAAAMAHQSLEAMDKWIAGGCGNRRQPVEPSGSPDDDEKIRIARQLHLTGQDHN